MPRRREDVLHPQADCSQCADVNCALIANRRSPCLARFHNGIKRQLGEKSGQFLWIDRFCQVRVDARSKCFVAALLPPEPGKRNDNDATSEFATDPRTGLMPVSALRRRLLAILGRCCRLFTASRD